MSKKDTQIMVPDEVIMNKIYLIRGKKVMLDRDLAKLYGIETKVLKQTVRRNVKRFPTDFMFEMSAKELQDWRSQIVTSNTDKMGLRSPQATEINIEIMRTFVRLRRILESNKELARKLEELQLDCDEKFRIVFEALNELMAPPEKKSNPIGFHVRETGATYRARKRKKK